MPCWLIRNLRASLGSTNKGRSTSSLSPSLSRVFLSTDFPQTATRHSGQVSSGKSNCFKARALALKQLDLPEDTCPEWRVAVWGKSVDKNTLLKDGDRLEVLRPLLVDPKEARRLRINQQGIRAAGLFAKRRQGAKAGY